MYARVTSGQLPPNRVNELIGQQPEEERQALAREPGFKGTMTLLNRQTGKVMTVGLWESEADVQASMAGHRERLARLRSALGADAGSDATVEVYEVVDEIRPQR